MASKARNMLAYQTAFNGNIGAWNTASLVTMPLHLQAGVTYSLV
jgi:hypothetical protein